MNEFICSWLGKTATEAGMKGEDIILSECQIGIHFCFKDISFEFS